MRTKLQEQVIARAKELLKGMPVCLDELRPDHEIMREGIEASAQALYVDTIYWESDGVPR